MLIHCSYFTHFINASPPLILAHIYPRQNRIYWWCVYRHLSQSIFHVCKYMDCRSCFLAAGMSVNSLAALRKPQYRCYIKTDYQL